MNTGAYLSLFGSLNFCSRTSPYLSLVLPRLYSPIPFVAEKSAWKQIKNSQIVISQNIFGRLAAAIDIVARNKWLDMDKSYCHWFEWWSDASDDALGWTSEGQMAREEIPPCLKRYPIFYKELWAVVKMVTQAPPNSVIVIHTDNIGVYHCVRKMLACSRAYWFLKVIINTSAQKNLFILPLWVSTNENPADYPSRVNFLGAWTLNVLWKSLYRGEYSKLAGNTAVELSQALKSCMFDYRLK